MSGWTEDDNPTTRWEAVIDRFHGLYRLEPWQDLPEVPEDWGRDPYSSDGKISEQTSDWVWSAWYAFVEQHDAKVRSELRRLAAREQAREKFMLLRQDDTKEPFDFGTLGEILNREVDKPLFRVDGLIPADGATLVVAQRKTGKTTLMLNLARSLLTGTSFLGCHQAEPVKGTVAFLNYEVSADQIAKWADEAQIPRDRLLLLNLRDRRNPLANDQDRRELAVLLQRWQVEVIIVDTFGRAYSGKSQNDTSEVGSWLIDLDRFARAEVGAKDLILSAHAGWEGERSRGSSALEDWADSIITLTRDKEGGDRYLRAQGRDVSVEEDRLDYDSDTRQLTLTRSGGRQEAGKNRHLDSLVEYAVAVVAKEPGASGYRIEQAMRDMDLALQKGDGSRAAKRAVELGLLAGQPGKRGGKAYFVIDRPDNPTTTPMGASGDDHPDHPGSTPTGSLHHHPDHHPKELGGGVVGGEGADHPGAVNEAVSS